MQQVQREIRARRAQKLREADDEDGVGFGWRIGGCGGERGVRDVFEGAADALSCESALGRDEGRCCDGGGFEFLERGLVEGDVEVVVCGAGKFEAGRCCIG